ncbi:MAG: serine-protein kinase RsbW [Pseudonocardiales bacterium]|nr:serine-protein kinase RsbW [Jatrophihabitantaceae bacterium]MCW2603246.1 serine-protein kinase RsbW [Pseudonocardiales bacterium]
MGMVTIQLPSAPAHVRTARLIAAAMARRAGVAENLLDEVRLAVGEACARAVQVQMLEGITTPITVEMADDNGFAVIITDRAATAAPIASATRGGSADRWGAVEAAPIAGLAILTAVVDDVQITAGVPNGTRVQVRWPVDACA